MVCSGMFIYLDSSQKGSALDLVLYHGLSAKVATCVSLKSGRVESGDSLVQGSVNFHKQLCQNKCVLEIIFLNDGIWISMSRSVICALKSFNVHKFRSARSI